MLKQTTMKRSESKSNPARNFLVGGKKRVGSLFLAPAFLVAWMGLLRG